MSALVLIPWAKTDWTDSRRLAAEAALPLNDEGVAQAERWGRQLVDKNLQCVFASEELTARETARAVAKPTGMRVRTLHGLEEVSFGLWEGLTEEALRTRFPKVYKRWKEDPASVCPPDGEDLAQAAQRIRASLRKATRKTGEAPIGVVMGPVACAVARCDLEAVALGSVRDLLTTEPVWYDEAVGAAAPGGKEVRS